METDVRFDIVKSILKSPHRKVDDLAETHLLAREVDPVFYTQFAIWYEKNGSVRDHTKLFTAGTITSPNVEFRPVGEFLLKKFPPKLVYETVEITLKHMNGKTGGKYRRLRKTVEEFLRQCEADAEKDDGRRFLRNAKFLRELYRKLHIAPSPRAAKSLKFRASNGTKPYPAFQALKELSKMTDEELICATIEKYKLPPFQVIGTVKEITPSVAAVLVDRMSPQEIVNMMSFFDRKGLLSIPEFKEYIDRKLKRGAKKLSFRAKKAAEVVDEGSSILDTSLDTFVESLPTINRKVALLIDRSQSMEVAITLGKEVAAVLSSKVEDPDNNLLVLLFNNTVQKLILPEKKTYTEFDKAFRYIHANGTTSLGIPFLALDKLNFDADTVVLITDGLESDTPYLSTGIEKYGAQGYKLICCLVGTTTNDPLPDAEVALRNKLVECEVFKYDADYYALPNLVKMIATGGMKDLVNEISAIDLSRYVGRVQSTEAIQV